MTRAMLCAAIAACALITACSNLPDVAAGTCGNGVVEPGEECDGATAGGTCGTTGDNACHFVCAGGATCPTGYTCGTDMRCRAPAAVFASAPGPYAFDYTDVAAGDVDGDGTDDLVGVSSTTLTARFGNGKADLFQVSSQPVNTPVAHSVFGDLDGDGHMDVLVPNAVGVFSFLASGQGFNPYPYTSITLDDQTSPGRIADVEVIPDPFSEMLTIIGKDMAYVNTKAQYTVCIESGTPPLCATSPHDAGNLLAGPIPTGRTGYEFGAVVAPAKDFTDEFALPFKAADHVDIWSPTLPVILPSGQPDPSTLSVEKIETLQLPKEGALGAQVRVADDGIAAFGNFDLDGCVDLLIPTRRTDTSGKYEGIAIAYGSKNGLGQCTGKLDPPVVVAEAVLDPTGTTKGLVPRAVADLDGDGVTDVVTNELIAVTSCTRDKTGCPNNLNNVFALDFRSFTPRTWTQALATDINKDGKPDIAGIVDGQDDVDLMLGAGLGFVNRFQVATTLPPRALRTGDFDGDTFDDVAVVIGDASDPTTEDDHLQVMFGAAAGGPTAAVDMGSFGIVQDVEPVSLFTDLQSIDLITDLIVIADRGTHRGVAPLIGSSTRRLLAPYLLGEGPATDQQRDTPVAIALGEFDGAPNKLPDVVALAHLLPTQSPTGSTGTGLVDLTPRIFMLSGQGSGDLVGAAPLIPGTPLANFEYRDAVWAAGRLAPSDTLDAIVGIDATDDKHNEVQAQNPYLFVAAPQAGGTWNLSTPAALPAPYNALRVHAIKLVDLDADGLPDLLVKLVSGNPKSATALVSPTTAIVLWNKNGTFDVANPSPVFPTSATCHGAGVIQADLDAAKELVSVCTNAAGTGLTVTLFDWNGSAWTQTSSPLTVTGDEPVPLVGDFDGDTLDDIAILAGTGATGTVQVYTQCAQGDVACATRTQSQPTTGAK